MSETQSYKTVTISLDQAAEMENALAGRISTLQARASRETRLATRMFYVQMLATAQAAYDALVRA
ncbi:MAG TPA: hypothetical protein VF800_11750 [Telluria sp.]|jgi:hypothetical protein